MFRCGYALDLESSRSRTMRKFSIQLMNYRCFSGEAPTNWTFNGDVLTSFVGPNNAGKSTLLRFFYELRPVFAILAQPAQIGNLIIHRNMGLAFHGVGDAAEIPSFQSTGPVILEFSISVDREADLSRVRLTMDRVTSAWGARVWTGPGYKELTIQAGQGFPGQVHTSNGTVPLQTEEFTAWMQCLISRIIYLPAYRNLINQGGGVHYEIAVGQDFIKLWDSWKNGDNVTQR
jgi:hypothetical protein